MKCAKYRQMLSEYQEGDLSKKEAVTAEKHLKTCKKCQKELESLREVSLLSKKLTRYEPGNKVVLEVKSFIYGKAQPERRTQFGPVLNMNDLAEFLRVDKETIEQYLDELPCFELGGNVLFRKKSIEEWMEAREKGFGFQIQRSRLNQILRLQN